MATPYDIEAEIVNKIYSSPIQKNHGEIRRD
jgi:hypothetical protein